MEEPTVSKHTANVQCIVLLDWHCQFIGFEHCREKRSRRTGPWLALVNPARRDDILLQMGDCCLRPYDMSCKSGVADILG